ncbi:hypothetical protein MUN81_13640 [Hymenobacter sp. 5317J-9]|uniref:hypothetical protein n=1 Tax=Hymenobacter sp. 5317J-9 TaxID=2932250 RepID=UPI001FD6F4DD|nr:hypothetical protein [Hymenobacter sp. 5317J-9]UOQ96291.1 hypothetical protein MUN81_13640 [Hymenobacter sp. 5317J-9]
MTTSVPATSSPARVSFGGRALGALVALLLLGAAPAAHAQTWMVSTTAHIKLGILDKYGQLGPYTATFVVHSEKTGKDYFLVKQLANNQTGIDVLFPTEPSDPDYFKTEGGEAAVAAPGRYTWECRVKGVKAVSGRFVFPEVGNDVTVINK